MEKKSKLTFIQNCEYLFFELGIYFSLKSIFGILKKKRDEHNLVRMQSKI
jgi:hypothetical protein